MNSTGLFDDVFDYANLFPLPDKSAVFVDFAGNAKLLRSVHEKLGDALTYSCLVGATHVDARGGSEGPPPGPAPILFFAPDHARASIEELGAKGFGEAVGASWRGFVAAMDGVVSVDRRQGLDSAADAFAATLAGKADPAVGIVVKPAQVRS